MTSPHPIEWTDEKVERLWDYYSKTPPFSDSYFSKVYGARLLQRSGLPTQQPLKVLDFGCGPGFIWDHQIALGAKWSYTGLDFSKGAIEALSAKASGHAQFGKAVHVASLPCPLPDESFDAVLLFEVVEHLTDTYLHATLREAYRVLVPGGRLLVSTPNDENLTASTKICPDCGTMFHEWQHVRSWNKSSLVKALADQRFAVESVETLDFGRLGPWWTVLGAVFNLVRGKRKDPHLFATFRKPK